MSIPLKQSDAAIATTSRHPAQVCGATSLTWKYPLHRLVPPGATLNGLLGDAIELTAHLGHRVLAGAAIPILDPLVPALSGTT